MRAAITFAAHFMVGLRAARTYALDAALGLLTYPVELAMTYLMWRLFLSSSAGMMSPEQVIGYYAITLLIGRIGPSRFVSLRLEIEINSGALAVHLVRPSVPWAAIAGRELAPTFVQFALLTPVAAAVVALASGRVPAVFTFIAWMALAVGLRLLIRLIVGTAAFWLHRIVGLVHAVEFLTGLASGSVLPLSFFPGPVQAALAATPFPLLVYAPAWAMLGQMPPQAGHVYAATGLVWTVTLAAAFHALWRRGIRRFTGAGI